MCVCQSCDTRQVLETVAGFGVIEMERGSITGEVVVDAWRFVHAVSKVVCKRRKRF